MDPLKCLQDLDTVVQGAPLDRKGHEHIMNCVATIRAALLPRVVEVVPPASLPDLRLED